MGLGIENALELSTGLSGALAGLTSDYSAAYVTFQRGGLDIGGGGALGASIGLQAKMLEAEKAGGDQSELATQMSSAMKETIASFTGGQIITVQQADADPALQAQYYAQTKLLGDLYDIQDPAGAARTLDYLDQLDETIASGNKGQIDALNDQIQAGVDQKDATLGALEKLNAVTDGSKAALDQIQINTKDFAKNSAEALAKMLIDPQKSFISGGGAKNFDSGINPNAGSDQIESLQGAIATAFDSPTKALQAVADSLLAAATAAGNDASNQVKELTNTDIVKAIDNLSDSIKAILNGGKTDSNGRKSEVHAAPGE
jgi:hypothetical protein